MRLQSRAWAYGLAVLPLVASALLLAGPDRLYQTAFGFQALDPSFADARNLTAAVDCAADGMDPLVHNPCDPWGRPLNYPRVWVQAFGLLSLGQSRTVLVGAAFALLFAAGLVPLIRSLRPPGDAVWWAVLVVSPPVILLLERGNIEGVVFALLVFAVTTPAARAGPLLWALATVGKIYPVTALPALLVHAGGRRRWLLLAAAAGVVAYFAVTLPDLRVVMRTVPQATSLSYGAPVLPANVLGVAEVSDRLRVLAGLVALVVVAGAWALGRRHRAGGSHLAAFHTGAAVYAGTFVMGSNWDYRLVVAFLMVPQLLEWAREASTRAVAWTMLLALAAMSWMTAPVIADAALSWVLLAGVAATVAASTGPVRELLRGHLDGGVAV